MLNRSYLRFRTDPGGSGGSGGEGGTQEPPVTETPPAGEPSTQGGGGTQMIPAAEAQEARREAQNLRQRLRAAEEERDALKQAQMSDSEKDKEQLKTSRQRVRELEETNRRLTVMALAPRAGIIDPEAAAALLPTEDLDLSDHRAVEKALKELVKAKPYLTGGAAGGSDGGAGGGVTPEATDMNARIRQAAGRA